MAIRITGGSLGGRLIRVPQAGVRPTQDRVRAAVFSSLAELVPGARVLDLFAGSGALGLEAISRGAARVCWVESDRRVLAVLRDNLRQLCGPSGPEAGLGRHAPPAGEFQVVADDALRFIRRAPPDLVFDLIFADPPYDRDGEWLKNILNAISAGSILAPNGLFIAEVSARSAAVPWLGWRLVRRRDYGETRVCVLARN